MPRKYDQFQLWDLESKIEDIYQLARNELKAKQAQYEDQMRKAIKVMDEARAKGELSSGDYFDMLSSYWAQSGWYDQMIDNMSWGMYNYDMVAKSIVQKSVPAMYADGFNREVYQIEHGAKIETSLGLYDATTVERLIADDPQLLPKPGKKLAKELKAHPDLVWNKQHIQSALLQAVLQGEGMYTLRDRLMDVVGMDERAAIRNARTMYTSAQNAGRAEAGVLAKKQGCDILKEWIAFLDKRTRYDHRQLHGERKEVEEPFEVKGKKIMYPGDPKARPELVYNCRCTLGHVVRGFEGDIVKSAPSLGDLTYEEWKDGKNKHDPGFVAAVAAAGTTNGKFTDDVYTAARKAAALNFDDRDKADREIRPWLDGGWDNLTEYEKAGVWKYTQNSNGMNRALCGYESTWEEYGFVGLDAVSWNYDDRWKTFSSSEFTRMFGKNGTSNIDHYEMIRGLTLACDKYELPKDMFLYRGSGSGGLFNLVSSLGIDRDTVERAIDKGDQAAFDFLRQAMLGNAGQSHAFTSTAIASDSGFTYKDITYVVYAPKGTHCLYAEPQSWYGDTVGTVERFYKTGERYRSVGAEAEIIIQRGTSFRFTSFEKVNGKWEIHMEIVEQPDYFLTGAEDTYNNGATIHQKR